MERRALAPGMRYIGDEREGNEMRSRLNRAVLVAVAGVALVGILATAAVSSRSEPDIAPPTGPPTGTTLVAGPDGRILSGRFVIEAPGEGMAAETRGRAVVGQIRAQVRREPPPVPGSPAPEPVVVLLPGGETFELDDGVVLQSEDGRVLRLGSGTRLSLR